MKWILLPGFDGTGKLFAPLLRALPPGIEPVVVSYPADRACAADELVEIVLARLPQDEPYVLIAESFSGPIALKAAAQPQRPPTAVVLCASFVQCPIPRSLIEILRYCGIAFGAKRPPRWLVRRYLLGGAEKAIFALFYRAIGEVSPRVLADRFSVLLEFDEHFAPSTLQCPLLYLQAAKDRLVTAHNFEIVQQRYPEACLEKIESPHLILQVQPQASIRAVLQFMAATRPGAPAHQKSLFHGGGFVVKWRDVMHKTALLFAGQGAQYAGMGRDLADGFPSTQPWLEQCRALLGFDLPALCFHGPEEELTKTSNAQPAIFLVSWLALQLLRERVPGFSFQAAAGLSLGELTALTAAGVFEFGDGLKLTRQRGRFMQEACELTRGSMAAVLGLDLEAMRAVCAEADVEVANLNCPGQIVISGETEKITRACQLAKSKGAKRAVPLPVAGAYHSRLMAGARPKVAAMLAAVSIRAPAAAVISNVTARPHTTPGEIAARLVEQVTSEVRWEDSMRYLLEQGFTRFIELGPGTTLSGFLKRIDARAQSFNIADAASLEATVRGLEISSTR